MGGIRGVLTELSFQLVDARLQGNDQRLGGARCRSPEVRRQGQVGQFHGPGYTASPPAPQALGLQAALNAYLSSRFWAVSAGTRLAFWPLVLPGP